MPRFPRQAIVLAAGLGTRLKPLTLRIPKPALPVGGLPILLYNLFLLKEAGVERITLNLHHRPEVIRKLLGSGEALGIQLRYSYEPKILGTAGGIAQALEGMEREPSFVMNGDILMDVDLKKVAAIHLQSKARATLVCVPKDRARVTSFVELDRRGRVWRIAGAPELARPRPKLRKTIFSGVHLLDPALFDGYPLHRFGCVIRQVYQPALEMKERLEAYQHQGSWWDLGTLEELKWVDAALWTRSLPLPILEIWDRVRRWSAPLFGTHRLRN